MGYASSYQIKIPTKQINKTDNILHVLHFSTNF
jgi:hypothetical protein